MELWWHLIHFKMRVYYFQEKFTGDRATIASAERCWEDGRLLYPGWESRSGKASLRKWPLAKFEGKVKWRRETQEGIPGRENSVFKGVKVWKCMACSGHLKKACGLGQQSCWRMLEGSVGARPGRVVCHGKGLHFILEDMGTLQDFLPGRCYWLGFGFRNLTLNEHKIYGDRSVAKSSVAGLFCVTTTTR